jgi:hypothetical protein
VGAAPHPQAVAVRFLQRAVVVSGPASLEEGEKASLSGWGRGQQDTPSETEATVLLAESRSVRLPPRQQGSMEEGTKKSVAFWQHMGKSRADRG